VREATLTVSPKHESTVRRKKRPEPMLTAKPQTDAIVLAPALKGPRDAARRSDPHARLDEAVGLTRAIGLRVSERICVAVARPRPDTLLSGGKVAEVHELIERTKAQVIVVDHPLSPVQQRNLERAWNAKVLDRTGLILEIFGERAQTKEGRLQVELAHLSYQKSRLVRSWTHLERQRGGRGFMGGPGERQIEADRRQIQGRIDVIRRKLAEVRRTRSLHRQGRKRGNNPVIALVGYTNAGKSTLFNRLTGESVVAKDQLFATLDPTMRAVRLPDGQTAILSDTVGFIADLPTTLVAAFRATLEEVVEADLIVHVRDIASEQSETQKRDVEAVLEELGVDPCAGAGRVIEVWNKADLLSPDERSALACHAQRRETSPALISAATGEGIDALLERLAARFAEHASHGDAPQDNCRAAAQ